MAYIEKVREKGGGVGALWSIKPNNWVKKGETPNMSVHVNVSLKDKMFACQIHMIIRQTTCDNYHKAILSFHVNFFLVFLGLKVAKVD